ncbi:CDP-alcohol phosphatidyltransferase family protein [candidate division KSB1 bacterium]|nr:CDP-alcohol phosphatidyltransferase family protein [candidate division KSB1 bacterium]
MIKEFFEMKRWGLFVGTACSFFSPMTWTWLSLVAAIAAFILVALGFVYWGFAGFLISALMDEIDGKVARVTYRATYLGGFTDGTIDRFVDFLMILCFFFLELPEWGMDIKLMLFILLFATLLPPFIVAYANHRRAVPDPTEKVIWRFAFRIEYVVLFLAALFFQPIQSDISLVLLYIALVLNWATVIQSMILTFIKAKNYDQRNEKASREFHDSLKDVGH